MATKLDNGRGFDCIKKGKTQGEIQNDAGVFFPPGTHKERIVPDRVIFKKGGPFGPEVVPSELAL